jgi:ferredoxin-NADP reductase
MPYGEFVVNAENDVCLLAGGTGVTAFTAFLAGLPAEHPHHVYLFYGARRPDLLIYRPLVEVATSRCPALRPVFLVEEGPAPGCLSNRMEVDVIWRALPEPLPVTYYLSGPPEMIRDLTSGLSQRGVTSGRIITDAWE